MSLSIDYYFSLNSPYTYMGHQRFIDLARRESVDVRLLPISNQIVFPATGGLPVAKRAPARQAYRLMELRRWSAFLDLPLNLKPAFWPADESLGVGMLMSLDEQGADAAAFIGAVLRAVWAEDRNIADADTLSAIATDLGHDGKALTQAAADERYAEAWRKNSEQAIERGVFGMPTFDIDGELFWGQDRLDFVERAIAAARA